MYMAEVPIGSTVINIDETTLPPGSEQTVGTDPTTVVVAEGVTATDLDGFQVPTGKLKGIIFEDTNGNGIQDPGEFGVQEVNVVVTTSLGLTLTLTTNEGMYMAVVPVGPTVTNIVESTLPDGAVQTAGTDPSTVNVPAGGTATDVDGFQLPFAPTKAPTASLTTSPMASPTQSPNAAPTPTSFGKVKGVVFWDKNGDETQDPGEPGIPNVDVVVTDNTGESQTITTGKEGKYMAMVPIGDAVIDIDETTLPPGYKQTAGTDPTTVTVPEGGTATDIDGFQLPFGRLEGVVYEDTNGNGSQDAGELGIQGVDVVVTDSLGTIQTLTTESFGEYSKDLPIGPASTNIAEDTLPEGAVQTGGSDPTMVVVTEGGTATDSDGFQLPANGPTKAPTPKPTGTVTGIVFEDVNNNEKQDPGEPGIPNVDVVITDRNGNKLTLTTDTNGAYTAQVPVGSTIINIVEGTLPPGYEQTVGTDPTTVIVPAGGTATDLDGYFIPTERPTKSPTASPTASRTISPTAAPTPTSFGKVKGIIYWDKDGNGTQDPDEPGIPGVDVVVTDTAGETQTVTTNGSGEYMAMVPISAAVIDIVDSTLPAGAEQTEGTDPTRVSVPEFGTATDIDGYKLPSGRLEGIVFDDVNGNGVKGPTEPGIGGVDVLVVDSAGISQTLTTDKDGVYATEVPAGPAVTDIVESTLPDGAVQTAGEDPSTIIVPEGGTATDIDGYQLPTDVPTKTPTRLPTVAPPISTPTAAPTPGGSGPGGGGQPTIAPTPGGGGQPTAAPTPGGGGQPTPGGGCINVDVDFETDAKGNPLAPGEFLQNEYASYGLILSANGGVGTTPCLFDSSNPGSQETCGDADLGSPNNACTPPGPGIGNGGRPNQPGANCDPLGNILIIQEKGEDCPDDPMMGGKIVFEFIEPAKL
jgi:pyrrolidone-carboxylate peptidase